MGLQLRRTPNGVKSILTKQLQGRGRPAPRCQTCRTPLPMDGTKPMPCDQCEA